MRKGKTAIVTGAAGSGMGRSIALTLAREGANVVANYLTSAESAVAVVAHIEKQGGQAVAFQAYAAWLSLERRAVGQPQRLPLAG